MFKVFQPLSPALASNYCGIYVTHYCAVTPGKAARGPVGTLKTKRGSQEVRKSLGKERRRNFPSFFFNCAFFCFYSGMIQISVQPVVSCPNL